VQNIGFLSDPTAGELQVGGVTPFMDGIVMAAVESLVGRYPGITFHLFEGDSPTLHHALQERKLDLFVGRIFRAILSEEEIVSDTLFEENLFVVGGLQSKWARRKKIEFAEIADEPWVMPERDNAVGALIAEGFRFAGWAPLKPQVISSSMTVRTRLVASNGFLTMLPGSMLYFGAKRLTIKALPVALPFKPEPVEIVILKNRSLSPLGELFIERLHMVARPLVKSLGNHQRRKPNVA
jgi:DNA-binding transcriptional LysR family regulator